VRAERGFSLLELLIVIVIISVLLVVAIERLLRLRFEAERVTVQSVIAAMRSGLSSLWHSGLRKVRAGLTSLEELESVVLLEHEQNSK